MVKLDHPEPALERRVSVAAMELDYDQELPFAIAAGRHQLRRLEQGRLHNIA
jgi:hypothetical protein